MLKWRKRREMEPLRGRNHEVTASKWGGNNGKKVMGCCCCLVTKSSLTLGNPMDCIACQTPLPMGFPRQEYWSRSPFPSPGDLPNLRIEPMSPALAGRFFTTEPLGMGAGRGGKGSLLVCVGNNKSSTLLRRRQWHPTPVLLPGKSHGRKSLVGCSPWGR